MDELIKQILTANVYDVANRTPIDRLPRLSKALDNEIFLKREDLQPIFSFKIRGAYNKIQRLPKAAQSAGIIAASAGNHAQGVALAAKKLGLNATIVMPVTTPDIKVESVKALGARVILVGDNFDQACVRAHVLKEQEKLTFIHPYDDLEVIAGQGTIGKEILDEFRQPLHALFVPVGGGGLIAGVAAYVKALRPDIKVIGVEAEDSACLKAAMEAGERVVLSRVGIFADGVAVAQMGEETWRIAKDVVDDVITVTTDEICAAIKDTFDDTRAIAEPAGALSLAGLRKYVQEQGVTGLHLMAVLSGANMNFDRLRHVSERAEMGEGKEGVFGVKIPERPGSFRELCKHLGPRNVTEFNYRFADVRDAMVFIGVQFSGDPKERGRFVDEMRAVGYELNDFSDNELAKLHVRYLVGGHATHIDHEVVYRFEFPERPGALRKFLDGVSDRWNISLFHYRNHGAAFGRVFMGMQVPPDQRGALEAFLNELAYAYVEESDNPAYRDFLGQ